ncbi:hypothetical protein AB0M36_34985 [Actinoplanes sp. NPDC051346]|uniref:hypothetical protein n=1 Tax=Actinoplanes sp. NPDC051346 TaxID=3155048 RepID=UPI00341321E6
MLNRPVTSALPWKLAAVAVAAALCVSGCSGSDSASDSGEPAVDTMLSIQDIKKFALPLDAYKAIGEQDLALDQARNRLLSDCLARFGFEVEPPRLTPEVLGENQKRYGITDPNRAAQYGYREPEVEQRERPKEPELSLEAQAVVTGEGQDTLAGQKVPEGGCIAEARRKLAEGAPQAADPELVNQLDQDARNRTEQDSRVRKVFAEWSACMKESGYDYSGPMDANNDRAFSTPKPTEKEFAVAVADVKCKQRTNLVNIWASVETAYQQRHIERHKSALDGISKNLQAQLAKAAQLGKA